MFINDPPKPQTRKELKVNVPVDLHRALRELTVETGLETPALVSQALNLYFQKLAEDTARLQRVQGSRSCERPGQLVRH